MALLKDTALGFLITYDALLYYAQFIGTKGEYGRPFVPTTIVIGAMNITMCLLLTWLANYLQKRNKPEQLTLLADAGGGGGIASA